MQPIFCSDYHNLILDLPACPSCGWQRPLAHGATGKVWRADLGHRLSKPRATCQIQQDRVSSLYLLAGDMPMKTRIQKWGNSLALRIPKSFAIETGLGQDSAVDVALVDGKLIVTPLLTPPTALEELLAGITDDNLHGEHDTGAAIGNEVW
jgi:antitoxin MazE